MQDEEESHIKKQGFVEQKLLDRPVLDPMSVSDLRTYIDALRAEILRAEEGIGHKQGARGHADQFFSFNRA